MLRRCSFACPTLSYSRSSVLLVSSLARIATRRNSTTANNNNNNNIDTKLQQQEIATPSNNISPPSASWGDVVSSSVATVWASINPLATNFEGLPVTTPEEIKQHAPSWYHPVRRMRYRKYLLEQEQKMKEQQSLQQMFSSLKASVLASATADISNNNNNTNTKLNISEQIKKLGLDPQSTISVLLVYVGFWCAVVYYALSVLYFSFYFHFFNGALPSDPVISSKGKDEFFDPEFFGSFSTSFSSSSSMTARNDCDVKFAKEIHDQLAKSNKLVILHSIPGCGKSTFTRWLSNRFIAEPAARSNFDQISDVIYVRVNSNNITSCDPLDIIGEYYGISSHHNVQHVFSIMNWFRKLTSSSSEKKSKPLLVFDIGLLPSSTPHQHLNQETSRNSLATLLSLSEKSSLTSGSSGFDLATFMNKVHALVSDASDQFSILVSVDSTLLQTQVPRSILASDSVSMIEISELDDRKASKFISQITDQYIQTLMPFSKKTPKFLKGKLAPAILMSSEAGNRAQNAKNLLAAEYAKIEASVAAVFANCKDEGRLRDKLNKNNKNFTSATPKDQQLSWADVESFCSNKYPSNAHFRLVAELNEGVFTSTGPSSYKPTFEVVGNKILAKKKFMEK